MKTILLIVIPLVLYLVFTFESKNKLLGKLSDTIVLILEVVLYCFALPGALVFSWLIVGALSEILDRIYFLSFENRYIFYGISIVVGIGLKIWSISKDKNRKANDFVCKCGKYRGERYKGVICDICGTEI